MAAMMMMAIVTEVRLVLTTGLPYDFRLTSITSYMLAS